MKKTYINPTITTVKVVMHQMIATSVKLDSSTEVGNDTENWTDLGKENNMGNTPGSYNIWEE